MELQLRAITDQDMPFLLHLYGTTRADELALTDLTDEEKDTFVRGQFHAQHISYTQGRPNARFDLVLADNQPIGRLYVDRQQEEIRLMDMALLPAWRGQGLGSRLMRPLLDESRRSGQPVTLHVERNNPRAIAWYQRLGFVPVWQSETHLFMSWPEVSCRPPG